VTEAELVAAVRALPCDGIGDAYNELVAGETVTPAVEQAMGERAVECVTGATSNVRGAVGDAAAAVVSPIASAVGGALGTVAVIVSNGILALAGVGLVVLGLRRAFSKL